MQKHIAITRRRIQLFIPKLSALLYPLRAPVALSVFHAPDRIPFVDALRGTYFPLAPGEQFGPPWSTHWVRVSAMIPADWHGREVHFLWDSCSEACIWMAGTPLQGLSGSFSLMGEDALRKDFCITPHAEGGEHAEWYVEVACNELFGVSGSAAREAVSNKRIGFLRQAELALFDRDAWELFWDFKIISDMAQHLPGTTPRGGQALFAANAMINTIRPEDRSTWSEARAIASRFLAARNGDGQHNISAVGHAHIDTAWLWPIAETKRKCIRSLASAVRQMDEYPEFIFACSQAQQLAWVKECSPALFDRIREKAAVGQFVPVGGTWVEPDCNLPSGESLVRQFLFGQRFFRREFGMTCREFWNPDVFGYSGALPQIMQLSGIDYFLTQKLSWNQFNKPASHTFLWEGIDGSRVLTHFPPADTYTSTASVQELLYNVNNFKDHERANESCLLFGYGDGGGGPTPGMLEQLRRMEDVDGLPRVRIRSPREFFARCAADIRDPTVWVGELYFELHRGTYTTHAWNKRFNRRCEGLLHDVEFLSALTHVLGDTAYPANELEWMWQHMLTNQFHDIIPGSSIGAVYEQTTREYLEIERCGEALRSAGVRSLVGESSEDGPAICIVNTLGIPREEIVELPFMARTAQIAADGRNLAIVKAPPFGYRIIIPDNGSHVTAFVTDTGDQLTLENEFICAVFDRTGGLVSLFDKRVGRECIATGETANRFVLFADDPLAWDAWDVDVFHLEKRLASPEAFAARMTETGPLRVSIEFEYRLSSVSTLTQTVSLTAISPRLDFATAVNWHEDHTFLKVEFPLNIRAQNATYEIQFGHLERPTHFNTSWDLARFEVCAHRWADLAEPDYGVALLNDCKYGHASHGNILRLSLLRSPTHPDPAADRGEHEFRYALLPHSGSFQQADVIGEASRFNQPLLLCGTGASPIERSYFSLSSSSVIIDTVKKAEDSDALILRLYEAHGSRGCVRVSSMLPVRSVVRCNLLEEEDAPLEWENGGVQLEVTPFRILTLKLTLQNPNQPPIHPPITPIPVIQPPSPPTA